MTEALSSRPGFQPPGGGQDHSVYRKFGGHLPEVSSSRKWRTLLLLALVELLAMAAWFSATAIVPALSDAWGLDAGGGAWLTMSVQIGFVVGTLLSAVFSLADRIPVRWFFASSALLAGLTTALIPAIATWLGAALALRFLIGIFLAGVYRSA